VREYKILKGQGVPLDYTKAIFWFRNAAENNDNYAQYNLGWAYESGTGVPKDTQEAVKWYRKAADGGNPEARVHLDGLTDGSLWWALFRHFGFSHW
jgi:TPR repeat protein